MVPWNLPSTDVTNAGGKKVGAAAVARHASHKLNHHIIMPLSSTNITNIRRSLNEEERSCFGDEGCEIISLESMNTDG